MRFGFIKQKKPNVERPTPNIQRSGLSFER